ncbi:MAG: VOC family protein [Bacteroidota bacterium]
MEKKGKVTGIGGVFFKTDDPAKTKAWYTKHLGFKTDEYGHLFKFKEIDKESIGHLQWSPFDSKTEYFSPSKNEFMINYRVENLVELKKELEADEVKIIDKIEEFEYGKFLHILDPEGRKIELWEPTENAFE